MNSLEIYWNLACHEKNISTQQSEAQAHARFSRAHEHEKRPGHYQCSPCQGPGATVCLTRRTCNLVGRISRGKSD
jgi:hypothetical protein